MKWIRSRKDYILEAKLRDVITNKQAKIVATKWASRYLDYNVVEATENIKQGKWKLSEEDKRRVLGTFFTADLNKVFAIFENLPEKFVSAVNNSLSINLLRGDGKWEKILKDFDLNKPTINQISVLTDPIFRKISITETLASEYIERQDNGRPVMDENNRPKKIKKEAGEIVYSKNLTNINSFLEDFNRCFKDANLDPNIFMSGDISRLVSKSREDFSGEGYIVEVDIYGKDMYLAIEHNPKDILNMSISRFYTSCQNLYTGGYNDQVLGNVFDPNSIPAFIFFESKIYNSSKELISDMLPVTRMMIRNVESFDTPTEPQIFFDRAYPDRMQELVEEIVKKYSENVHNYGGNSYYFTPDVDLEDNIREPYMDKLNLQGRRYIGSNCDSLYLSRKYDWNSIKISPNAKVREIVIDTPILPENSPILKFTPEWIKFKFLNLLSLDPFKTIKTSCVSFEKCNIKSSIIPEILNTIGGVKKVQFISCKIEDENMLSNLGDIDELHLIYSLEGSNLKGILGDLKCKKYIFSGDIVSENLEHIKYLKSQGVKIETIGPII